MPRQFDIKLYKVETVAIGGIHIDIKKAIMQLVNSEKNIRQSCLAAEKLVEVMLADYLKKQNKKYETRKMMSNTLLDALLPNGIDDIGGRVALDIKITRNGYIYPTRIWSSPILSRTERKRFK